MVEAARLAKLVGRLKLAGLAALDLKDGHYLYSRIKEIEMEVIRKIRELGGSLLTPS